MTRVAAVAVWLAAACLATAAARAEDGAQVQVATLDGESVYHWRAFDGKLADDVDRALVLREFKRKGFKLSERLVDESVHGAIGATAGGDETKLVKQLRQQGVTLADYRRFVAEEITIDAMLYQKTPDEGARARWLATLRENARIVRSQTAPNTKG